MPVLSKDCSYASFIKCENHELLSTFITSLEKHTNCKTLLDIIKAYKKIKCQFFKMDGIEKAIYIVMINGNNDGLLVKLAKEYNFPRGCPIVWIPDDDYIKFQGFYPKFKNAEKPGNEFTELDNKKITSVAINPKVSGFLAHVVGFKYNDIHYWTVCSKKSASHDSEFVIWAHEIISKLMTEDLIKKLCDNFYIAGEVLIRKDNCHGYITERDMCCITCVGQGFDTNSDPSVVNGLMSYYNVNQIYDFCTQYKLSCCDQVQLVETERMSYKDILSELFKNRSIASTDTYEKSLSKLGETGNAIIKPGVSHKDINSIMEGTILFIEYLDDVGNTRKLVIKVKFGYYVLNTMFLRPYILSNYLKPDEKCFTPEEFIKYWITSEYQDYFSDLCNKAVDFIKKNHETLDVSSHIFIGEHVRKTSSVITPSISIKKEPHVLYVLAGLVGGGKTILGNFFGEKYYLCHIDGDYVCNKDGTNYTYSLGSLRNPTTSSKIYKAISEGKTVIISCGGGALLPSSQREPERLTLLDNLETLFDQPFKLVLLYISPNTKTVIKCKDFDEFELYIGSNDEITEKAFKDRVKRGEYSDISSKGALSQALEKLQKRSKENENIMKYYTIASIFYVLPCITHGDDLSKLLPEDFKLPTNEGVLIPKFRNVWFVVICKSKIYHITWIYNNDVSGVLPVFDVLEGTMYTVTVSNETDKRGKVCSVIIFEDLKQPSGKPLHVTINMCGLPNKDSTKIYEYKDKLSELSFSSSKGDVYKASSDITTEPAVVQVIDTICF